MLLTGLRKFPGMNNEELYPDLGNDTSSVWNFYSRSSDVNSRGRRQPAKTAVSPRTSPLGTFPAAKSEEKRLFSQARKTSAVFQAPL